MENLLTNAIETVETAQIAYCKFLSANDTKATKSHQSGYLISKGAWKMFLSEEPSKGANIKTDIVIKWQESFERSSVFTYYGEKKDEFRITQLGHKFPFREQDNVGDLFVLAKIEGNYYKAYIFSHDEDIENFFAAVNISPTDTNRIIEKQFEETKKDNLKDCFIAFLNSLTVDFPSTANLATTARNCYNSAFNITLSKIQSNPDAKLLSWIESEFDLFKTIENERYARRIQTPFQTVEELIDFANTILNRRKSRAGKSLEHHLQEVFSSFQLSFNTQAITEGNKKPDFLFPSVSAYRNKKFDDNKLITLASKTTCKDRWRQILNEADRVKTKHLFTLQQGISKNQLEEMYKYNVRLVVPKPYIETFPKEFRPRILTLENFIKKVQQKQ